MLLNHHQVEKTIFWVDPVAADGDTLRRACVVGNVPLVRLLIANDSARRHLLPGALLQWCRHDRKLVNLLTGTLKFELSDSIETIRFLINGHYSKLLPRALAKVDAPKLFRQDHQILSLFVALFKQEGSEESAKSLQILLRDFDPKVMDSAVLHFAVWHGRVEEVKVLLADGRVDVRGRNGSALRLARERGLDEISSLLEKNKSEPSLRMASHSSHLLPILRSSIPYQLLLRFPVSSSLQLPLITATADVRQFTSRSPSSPPLTTYLRSTQTISRIDTTSQHLLNGSSVIPSHPLSTSQNRGFSEKAPGKPNVEDGKSPESTQTKHKASKSAETSALVNISSPNPATDASPKTSSSTKTQRSTKLSESKPPSSPSFFTPSSFQNETFQASDSDSASLSDDHDTLPLPSDFKLPRRKHSSSEVRFHDNTRTSDVESSSEGPLVFDFEEDFDSETGRDTQIEHFGNVSLAPSGLPTKSLALKGVVFDVHGNAKVLDQNFKKVKFCADNTLQPRDLRKIDSTTSDQHPVILVRKNAILVNLAHIKALIKSDSLILFSSSQKNENNSPEDIYFHSAFVHELQVAAMQSEMNSLRPDVEKVLDSIDRIPDAEYLRELLLARRRINKFVQKVDSIRSTLSQLLHNDEDLVGMYLTDKAAGRTRLLADHMDAELMLEHYLNMTDEIHSIVSNLSSNVTITQQMMAIALDAHRNKLIVYDLKANLATMAISSAALIAGLFGMNLPSSMEGLPYVFFTVSGMAVAIAGGIFLMTLRRISLLKSGSNKILRRILE
ncbi:magnesium ion transporter [Phlyctochytrium planicorne]|nr:magnesium ion transporter [Phlyctochytrium planicorne]